MKQLTILLFSLAFSLIAKSQSVYDDTLDHQMLGVSYFPNMRVDKDKEIIQLKLLNRSGQVVYTKNIAFEALPLERYLSFYNSIGLLQNADNQLYFYDFINNNKLLYNGQYNRYNEGIKLGKFNPVLKNNVLSIIDENLKLIKSIKLKVAPKSGQFWIIESIGSDVITGKFQLLKCVKIGTNNSESMFKRYSYDVETGILLLLQ
jgi:hypothetical protein